MTAASNLDKLHAPVLLAEALQALNVQAGGVFVDATLGLGGHTASILAANTANRVIGFDRDAEAIALAQQRLVDAGTRLTTVHADYREMKAVLTTLGIEQVTGIIADLGISSYQLDTPERGFSFRFTKDAPLDMRMDRSAGMTAAELLRTSQEQELADVIYHFGEERAARKIARKIVQMRHKIPFTTTKQLADVVIAAVQQKGHWKIHPATKTFQALRIAVNRELDGLTQFIDDAVSVLATGGRLAVITFHSLEDRPIKQALKFQSGYCACPPQLPDCRCGATRRIELLTSKPVQPSAEEINQNPRARSAKLRAACKL